MAQYFSCKEVYGHTTVLEHIHAIQNINPCLDSLNCTFFSSSSISRISFKDKSLDCFFLMFTNQLIEQNALIIVGENANICIRFDRECVYRDAPIFLSFVFELFFFFISYTFVYFIFFKKGEGVHVPDHKYHTNILETYIYMSIHYPYFICRFQH